MNRGVDRQKVFFSDRDRVGFGRLVRDICEMFGVEVLAYCLMDNHYHLVLKCPSGNLSEAMQHLISVYTRHTNDRVGRDGPLFRGRFHSKPVLTVPYLVTVVRYVHLNPLAIAGVDRPDAYRWSSHGIYLGRREEPVWMNCSEVSQFFDGPADFARFVAASGCRIEPSTTDLVEIDAIISLMIESHAPDSLLSARLARAVAVRLADRATDARRQLLLDRLAFTSLRSQQQALRHSRSRAAEEPMIDEIVAAAERMLFDVSSTRTMLESTGRVA